MSSIMDMLLAQPPLADKFMSVLGQVQSPAQATGGALGAFLGPQGGSPSHWEDVGRRIAANQYGYSPEEQNKLDYIATHESGWNPNAVNQNGGAWGIPQIYPLQGRPTQGSLTPPEQIKWMLNYIQDRYGSVDNAYNYWLANQSY